MLKLVVILFAGFASQGGRASVTYQPTPLKGDGQGCPSDESKAQVIENIHSLIEERVETESTPETRLLTELNTAVETLSQEVAELANNSQTVNETLTELSQEVAELSDTTARIDQVVNVGQTPAFAVESCRALSEDRPDLPSGNYWIRSSNGTAVQVYCDMSRQCCGGTTGGWTRVAYLDMTDPNQQCPSSWQPTNTSAGIRACTRTNSGGPACDSVSYPIIGNNSYSQVCGRVTGYQYCNTQAFDTPTTSIDETYLDGVSITHGSPRQHVWSFAVGTDEVVRTESCPCIATPNLANSLVPSFVGEDYFCDTGYTEFAGPCRNLLLDLRVAHPLWDGGGCGPNGDCCENNNPPWFCKTLPQPTTDDIEVRICADTSRVVKDIAVGLIEIFVN